ncbi:MAG TPA: class II aldolase/adducin family protein [Pirellulales bacterium]|nr:class II aldolase/adducin family protein [Pirellulales bacterium]
MAAESASPREQVLAAIERIYRYRMTTTSGGNISLRDSGKGLWITPAAIDKGSLSADDMMLVRDDGTMQGKHRPSSELPFHQAIYAARPDIRAVVHAHPVALVAFSICKQTPNTRLLYQSERTCGKVGLAPYALPGSASLGENIASTFAAGYDCVVLENHGVVTGGPTLQKAFERFETLEFTARTVIQAAQLGAIRYLNEAQAQLVPASTHEPATFVAPPANEAEEELRLELAEFVRRAYRQRLMISTQGAFSARLDDDSFLITPHAVDRSSVSPAEMVLVRGDQCEAGRRPSSAMRNHAAIYHRQPWVQAIVNAYPINATAFGVTDVALDSRTIPEAYILLREVQRLPYGARFGDGRELAELATPQRPITLLENDGVQVCGTSVLDAFDRLEVLESTAEALIAARVLGPIAPMPSGVIADLARKFFPAG